MLQFVFSLLTLLVISSSVTAQSLDPASLKTPADHAAFFDTIQQLHQELIRRSGPTILAFGWESAEHLALRDSTLKRNAFLRETVEDYLDRYGFPGPSHELKTRRKRAESALMKEAEKIKWQDSIARDSVMRVIAKSFGNDISLRDTRLAVLLILDTEPNFDKRCENIGWLRFEWEEGNLPTEHLLAYLRHTYAAKHGKELDIATGSTEQERVLMHARELLGCWGH